uniref:C2H2-type domain-containing protein n=1 Tax=Iconisemion striatum TaxID=60296 RepID=A0A1A7XDS1_9TELE
MIRNRMCLLCETVCISKPEIEKHMRSMLHHRELEKLKGRDCGHECRVCTVKVASLTDYASHICSTTHKQNVEAADKLLTGSNQEEDYFDQELVDLIEKRNQQIRREKEAAAAAAKLAKEEEEQRQKKEDLDKRLKEVKERYRLECVRQAPSQGFSNSSQPWHRSNYCNTDTGNAGAYNHYNKQERRSATWHAQYPPNFQRFAPGDFPGRRNESQEGRSSKTWSHGCYSNYQTNRLPWLSNEGSRYGLYGHNNLSRFTPKPQHQSFLRPPRVQTPTSLHSQTCHQSQSSVGHPAHGVGFQNQVAPTETAQNSSRNTKGLGSNVKLDKGCRWSPYPVTSEPHSDTHSNTSENHHNTPKVQKQQASGSNRQPQPEPKPVHHGEEERGKPSPSLADQSCTSTKGTSRQTGSGSSSQMKNKPLPHVDQKNPSGPGARGGPLHSKVSGQNLPQSKSPGKQSGLKESIKSHQSKREKFPPESISPARLMVPEKRECLSRSADNGVKMIPHTEKQQTDQGGNQTEATEKSCSQAAVKPSPPGRPAPSSDTTKYVQSLQVSTSTVENMEPAASARSTKESRDKPECQSSSVLPDQAVQVTESDTSGANASAFSKHDLPPGLKWDLTKHISSKGKTGAHKPNLNIARRVRNLSESRRSDTEKDSGLKTTVMQLIGSSWSRRNVNWDQVSQEIRKKQDKGKGMPRFGIEMVANEQESQSQEDDDIPILEGFQWESLMDVSLQASSRKRSLSESSLAPAPARPLFASLSSEEPTHGDGLGSGQPSSTCPPSSISAPERPQTMVQKQPDKLISATVKVLQRSHSTLGDSSSGAEPLDQGTGKRRRAAGDVPSTEVSCLEHNSKRRKVKSKKERLQIDQLLAVSLREEELSRSLQNVDASLIQARAALDAAYLEVQRLIMAKQQISVKMSSLRSQRIELLKGMQGAVEEAPEVTLKLERVDLCEASLLPSSVLDNTCSSPAAGRPSPPSTNLPLPVVIKEEPKSPVHISSEPDPWSSRTPELPVAPATASPEKIADSASNFQSSPGRRPESYQTICAQPAGGKEKLPGRLETTTSNYSISSDSQTFMKPLSPCRRGSEAGSTADCADSQSRHPTSFPHVPASPSELGTGNRVRKLKKRKALKKALGTEQPESSDTEMDEEALRPRWRQRRRPSGGSQVSTSSQPTDDREVHTGTDKHKKTTFPALKLEKDQKSPKQMVELPQTAGAAGPLGDLDEDESMEVTTTCQQHQAPAPPSALEPQSLACNKINSTSDMDLCKSSESDFPFAVTLPKNSSDALSDQCDDELLTEGVFDGHQEVVNALQIHNGLLYTCSADRTVRAFDLVSHECVGVFEGHSSKVTCLLISTAPCLHHRLYSASSDKTIRCYSLKTRELEQQFSLPDRVLCLHSRWKTLYAGLANGTVVTFNLRTNKQMDVFECHGPRGVSCLASSQEGAQRILLVGSYDSTISVRAAKHGLLLRTLKGHTKSVLCMTVVNDLVFSGSSDHSVHAYNIHTGELVRVYKGHSHAVTVVTVLGKVMVTACLDKLVRVYDMQSQDLLQVYAGHKDMVLCMAIHNNMIYSGCYDGSVQAIKLNLTQNHRCWWHGCSLVFGVMDHLQQHLIGDHTGANFQTMKCRWKNCEEFICRRNKQVMLLHLQKHAEELSEL